MPVARGEGLLRSVRVVAVGGVLAIECIALQVLDDARPGALQDELVLVGGQVQARRVDRQELPRLAFEVGEPSARL